MLLIFAAIVLCVWLQAARPSDDRSTCLASAALAAVLVFALLTRIFFATAIPAFLYWFLAGAWRSAPGAAQVLRQKHVRIFAIVSMAGVGVVLAMNAHYFGSMFRTAYYGLGHVINFDGPWVAGFKGVFSSPLKSPLYFFPLVIVFPMALAYLVWRSTHVAVFVILFLAPQMYLIPKYSLWDGGPDLFARFWLRVVPLVLLTVLMAAYELSTKTRANAACLLIVLLLSLLGLRAQLLTAMTEERAVYAGVAAVLKQRAAGEERAYGESLLNLLTGRTIVSRAQVADLDVPAHFLFFRSAARPAGRLWAALGGPVVGALSIVGFWEAQRRRRARPESAA
jgi:hypothetical protein